MKKMLLVISLVLLGVILVGCRDGEATQENMIVPSGTTDKRPDC